MSFSLYDAVIRLVGGDFEDLLTHRRSAAKLGSKFARQVEVAYAKGCLLRVRRTASVPFWEELEGLIKANEITIEELGTNQQEMRRLRRKVDVASARWAFCCFRGSLSQMHRRNLGHIMAARGVRYADIGTTRAEVESLKARARAKAA
jgi:hypothetical protein